MNFLIDLLEKFFGKIEPLDIPEKQPPLLTESELEGLRRAARMAQERRELWFALQSRVLTDAEMKRVEEWGDRLTMDIYDWRDAAQDRSKRLFMEALLNQFRMRNEAKR